MKKISLFVLLTFLSNIIHPSPTTLEKKQPQTSLIEFTYQYAKNERSVPLKIYFPKNKTIKPAPVILISHSLGGSRNSGTYLAKFWSENGFIVIAMQHQGSDINIIKGKPNKHKIASFKKAMNVENYLKRIHDVPATIDQITTWNTDKFHPLFEKLNLDQIGMSGHSFGAITTQSLSGQSNPISGNKFTDNRIKAAFAMSPSSPRKKTNQHNSSIKSAFSTVKIPWLLMTGTHDKIQLTPQLTPESRLEVFNHLPKGDKYQLILHNATHMAFSDRTLFDKNHHNQNHHQAIKTISLKFFQSYLQNDNNAKKWITSNKVKSILDPKDSWQKK